jgi:hypothetical protein
LGYASSGAECALAVTDQISSVGEAAVFFLSLGTSGAALPATAVAKIAKLTAKFPKLPKLIKQLAAAAELLDWAASFGLIIADALESSEITPVDAVRVKAELQAIVDPTGASSIVAAYAYDTCNEQDYTLIRTAVDSRYCIDLPGKDVTNGNNLGLWACWGGENQKWLLDSDGSIRSMVDNDKCIDIQGAPTDNGTPLEIYDCHQGVHKWEKIDGRIRSKSHPNKCIDLAGGKAVNGGKIILWNCHDGKNQKWL